MEPTAERLALRRLLDAVDGADASLPGLLSARPRDGEFFGPLQAHGLDEIDVGLLLVALSARLSASPWISGEELVTRLCAGSANRLAALAHLEAGAPLVLTGVLMPDAAPEQPGDALTSAYRLGRQILVAAARVFGRPPEPIQPLPVGPYRTNGELLADLRRLSLHYRRRASRVFSLDPWAGTGIDAPDAEPVLVRRAREAAAHVTRRMTASNPAALPVLGLKDEHGLDLDELVVLVTLLFQEVLEGVALVDAVDLVRLVSENEEDLLRRRHMLRPLERAGLLRLEGAYAGKDLTADASLPNAVVDALVGLPDGIDADERIDFHAYLQGLDSSDPFFFDLGPDEI